MKKLVAFALLSQLYHSHLVATNLLNLPNLLLKQKRLL